MFAIMGSLSAAATPYVGTLTTRGKVEASELEYHNVQTAVTAMLSESDTHTLIAVGPTDDMNLVRTTDQPPLVLSDYLLGHKGIHVRSSSRYTFTASGTVIPDFP
ncbi:MAG: hypothetical protein ABID87_04180 [Chloroflexota bacterium]